MNRLLRSTVICLFLLLSAQILSAAEVNPTNEGNAAVKMTWGKKIDVQFKDMLLPDALDILLKDTGITLKVDPEVGVLKVTADFRGVSLRQALVELERVSHTIVSYCTDSGGMSISLVKDSWIIDPHGTVFVNKYPDPSPQMSQLKSQDDTVPADAHAIPLKYYTPVDIIRLLEVPDWVDFMTGRISRAIGPFISPTTKGITSISVRPDSKTLFVTGEDSAVAELTQFISKIDVEPQQTHQIIVHVTHYALGSVIPNSIQLASPYGGSKICGANKSQIDALTSELRDKGIEPRYGHAAGIRAI